MADGRPAARAGGRAPGDPPAAGLAARLGTGGRVRRPGAAPAVAPSPAGPRRGPGDGRVLGAVPRAGVGTGTGTRRRRPGRGPGHPHGTRPAPRRRGDGGLCRRLRTAVDSRVAAGPRRPGRARCLAHPARRGAPAGRGLGVRRVHPCPARLCRRVRATGRARRVGAPRPGPGRRRRGAGAYRPRDPRRPRARRERDGAERRGRQADAAHRPHGRRPHPRCHQRDRPRGPGRTAPAAGGAAHPGRGPPARSPGDGNGGAGDSLSADLRRLVGRLDTNGTRARLDLRGEPGGLPADLTAQTYRIVQEALTNVVKHAPPDATIQVRVDTGAEGPGRLVHVQVENSAGTGAGTGTGAVPECPAPLLSRGHGLTGMRERAALHGGSVDAGPTPGGGYRVTATLRPGTEPTTGTP